MAQQTTITLTDDLDGGKADETVLFALDGSSYEIDLSTKNAAALRKALAGYRDAARKVPDRSFPRARRKTSANDPATRRGELAAIREWARANGIVVSDRGRVATTIIDAYRDAAG